MIAAALLLALSAAGDGADARFDCVLGPRGTRDRDRTLTLVLGGYAAHADAAGGWSGVPEGLRIGGARDLFKGMGPATIAYHPAGGIDIAVKLADGRDAKLTFGKASDGPGTLPLALDVSGSPAFSPLSGGCTIATGDFTILAQGVGS